jgi:hypothetical protein
MYRIEFKDQFGVWQVKSAETKGRRIAEARALLIERDADRIRNGLPPEHPEVTAPYLGLAVPGGGNWNEAVAAYLNELTRKGSGPDSDHYRDSRTLLARIGRECKWPNLLAIKMDAFTAFLGRLAAAGRAPRTQNRYHETLRAFLNFCVRQGWLDRSPSTASSR